MKRESRIVEIMEHVIESFLWKSRLIILLGVLGLLVCSAIVFCLGLIETYNIAGEFILNLRDNGLGIHDYKPNTDSVIVSIITVVDDFLLGIVLLIFGLGTYDLFISRIDPAEEQDDIRPDWLVFSSLDELKSVLGKVVLMIMIINFLKFVVGIGTNFNEPLHILYLGGGICLVALALKFSHGSDIDGHTMNDRRRDTSRKLESENGE